jgi:hypothetical protein
MPPRHAYWTILIGNAPTAFRARERDELLPTFERLRAKQPDAVMRWFERGRLWNSPDEARLPAIGPREKRGAGWRPGGTHRDPRERFKGGPRDKGQRTKDKGPRPKDQGPAAPKRDSAEAGRRPWSSGFQREKPFQGQRPKDEEPATPKRDSAKAGQRPRSSGFQGQKPFHGQRPKDEGRWPASPKRDGAKAGDNAKPWRPKGGGFQGQRTKDERQRRPPKKWQK